MIISYRLSLRRRRPPGWAQLGLAHCAEGARRRRRSAQRGSGSAQRGSGSVHMVAVPVHMVAVPVHMVAVPWEERPFFLRGAFGARLRRRPSARPSATIGHHWPGLPRFRPPLAIAYATIAARGAMCQCSELTARTDLAHVGEFSSALQRHRRSCRRPFTISVRGALGAPGRALWVGTP